MDTGNPRWRRGAALSFLIGAVLGSALDALHTYGGVTSYPSITALGMPWWTPIVFGSAGLGIGLAHALTEARLRRPIVRAESLGVALAALLVFAALYALSATPLANSLKLTALGLGAAGLWIGVARTAPSAAIAAGAALVGPAFEIVLLHFGGFRHHQPDFIGVPMWLPALYATGSVAYGAVARWLF